MSFRGVFGMVSKTFCIHRGVCILKYFFVLGCLTCYTRDTVNPINGKTMQDLYVETKKKVQYLKKEGYNIVEKWECDLKRELNEDGEM